MVHEHECNECILLILSLAEGFPTNIKSFKAWLNNIDYFLKLIPLLHVSLVKFNGFFFQLS